MENTDKTNVRDYSRVKIVDLSVQEFVRTLAYEIKDAAFGTFQVYSGRDPEYSGKEGWWIDRPILEKLIYAFKADMPVNASLVYAGITKRQYFEFRKVHPEWDEIKDILGDVQMPKFINTLNTEGPADLATVRWYLERRHPKFAGKARPEVDEPLQPTVNIAIGNNADAGIVQATIREIAREVFGHDHAAGTDSGGAITDLAGKSSD